MKDLYPIIFWIVDSVGGLGVLIIGLSTWIATLIAKSFLLKLNASSEHKIEELKSDLNNRVASNLEKLKVKSQNEIDFILRKREVYENLAKSLRIFQKGDKPTDCQKQAFLEAYDLCYLWASDSLIEALNNLVDILLQETTVTSQNNQSLMKERYQKALLEMRIDSGFPETNVDLLGYRFIRLF